MLVFLVLLAALPGGAAEEPDAYPDPSRHAEEIAAFRAKDAQAMPETGQVVFVGSSSIRMWHDHLEEDMAPLEVIGRGFGGSTMRGLNHYADAIVFPYEPKAIVLYEGDNDIASGVTADRFIKEFQAFMERAREELPETTVYFLSIKPSSSRWELWPRMREANERVKALADRDPQLEYVDVATVLLDASGRPDDALFLEDQLHLNRAGYLKWREVVREALGLSELGGRGQ